MHNTYFYYGKNLLGMKMKRNKLLLFVTNEFHGEGPRNAPIQTPRTSVEGSSQNDEA